MKATTIALLAVTGITAAAGLLAWYVDRNRVYSDSGSTPTSPAVGIPPAASSPIRAAAAVAGVNPGDLGRASGSFSAGQAWQAGSAQGF